MSEKKLLSTHPYSELPGSVKKIYNRKLMLFAALISVIVVLEVSIYFTNHEDDSETTTISTSNTDSNLYTFYKEGYPIIQHFQNNGDWRKYNFLDGYNGIIEPYAAMALYVDDSSEYKEYKHIFSICPQDSSSSTTECKYGESYGDKLTTVTSGCTPYDVFDTTISVYSSSDELVYEYSGQALCLYVRREFRNLTKVDLDKTLDAMFVLHVTGEEEGQAKYGEDFHNATFFTNMHYFQASFRDSDHFHEGDGFLAQHLKITYYYEKAIQSVDPSISLFYWDYTIDGTAGYEIFDSPMFTADTFGTINRPVNETMCWQHGIDCLEDARIKDGRWKDWEVEYSVKYAEKFPFLHQGRCGIYWYICGMYVVVYTVMVYAYPGLIYWLSVMNDTNISKYINVYFVWMLACHHRTLLI